MKLFNRPLKQFLSICFLLITGIFYGQNGHVTINQASELERLLEIKKNMNLTDTATDRYKIQIFSGNRSGALEAIALFNETFSEWPAIDVYETPNYKVWVGSFRSRLEADRALDKIKETFNDAFRFRPKKVEKPQDKN
ncbi:SPOR domain-containing protein [Bizionia sediminis]|uniref:SPOR domain-containing protein n=1 Tax=Bizionia sediminis TaxID=1737064 RepID=A0ABW5KT31_9FLAO